MLQKSLDIICEHPFQLRSRTRLRSQYIQRGETVNSLLDCEKLCLQERNFQCLSFNYIQRGSPTLPINCELSAEDYRLLDFANINYFEISEEHDFYAREPSIGLNPCIDVTQECTPGKIDIKKLNKALAAFICLLPFQNRAIDKALSLA